MKKVKNCKESTDKKNKIMTIAICSVTDFIGAVEKAFPTMGADSDIVD